MHKLTEIMHFSMSRHAALFIQIHNSEERIFVNDGANRIQKILCQHCLLQHTNKQERH